MKVSVKQVTNIPKFGEKGIVPATKSVVKVELTNENSGVSKQGSNARTTTKGSQNGEAKHRTKGAEKVGGGIADQHYSLVFLRMAG